LSTSYSVGGFGRIPAVITTVVLAFVLMGGVGWVVGMEVFQLARELPGHKEKIRQKIASLRDSGDGVVSNLLQMISELGGEQEKAAEDAGADKQVVVAQPRQSSLERLASTVPPVLEPLATAGLILCLVIYMLIRREDLRNRMIGLA
jgi:predicted PurR-regulated permease PerM